MADRAGTVETVGVRVDEGIEPCDGHRLLRPSLAVCGEECLQSAAVHSTGRRGAALALMRMIDHTRSVHIPDRAYDGNLRVLARNGVIDSSPLRLLRPDCAPPSGGVYPVVLVRVPH